MLKRIRITAAIICFSIITMLFLDFTGTISLLLGWFAKLQFFPALLALNIAVIISLVGLTILLGRVYCSVICPMGVYQDVISHIAGKIKKNRFSYSPALTWLRYLMLALFAGTLFLGFSSLAALIEPYSMYGRIASNLFSPVYQWGNNILASIAERAGSYSFYSVDIVMNGILPLSIAISSIMIVSALAWRNGRTFCNTVCPVGTILGLLSRFSLLKPVIDVEKCNQCGLCAKNCKSSCIDSKSREIDYSRCVECMDCIDKCRQDAIKYTLHKRKNRSEATVEIDESRDNNGNNTRRNFITTASLLGFAHILKAQPIKFDGGLAPIKDKKAFKRSSIILPPGAISASNMEKHCTACQLCITSCPNHVLHSSESLNRMMQPEVSFERGYCRPECVKCSEVCPTGAINAITRAEKSSLQIGHAVWIKEKCVVNIDKVSCGNCARHCPTGAIHMVSSMANDENSLKIPVVDTERCIGCGACENLCPASPYSAIHVEGHERHRRI